MALLGNGKCVVCAAIHRPFCLPVRDELFNRAQVKTVCEGMIGDKLEQEVIRNCCFKPLSFAVLFSHSNKQVEQKVVTEVGCCPHKNLKHVAIL